MKAFILSALLSMMILSGCGKQNSGLLFPSPTPTPQESKNAQITQQGREFTIDELRKFDGKNGNKAYVAVDGVVYDVTDSDLWRQGKHEDCSTAGQDLTDKIGQAPHTKELLKRMPVVGTLRK